MATQDKVNTIIGTPQEITHEIRQAVREELKRFLEEQKASVPEKVYYINQVAKMLNRSHATIKKMVANGVLKTTKNGMIAQSAIEAYLNGE